MVNPGAPAGNPASAPSAPAPPVPPVGGIIFALHLAQADTNVIDYKGAKGMKLYKEATTKLPQEFDGDAAHICMLL